MEPLYWSLTYYFHEKKNYLLSEPLDCRNNCSEDQKHAWGKVIIISSESGALESLSLQHGYEASSLYLCPLGYKIKGKPTDNKIIILKRLWNS